MPINLRSLLSLAEWLKKLSAVVDVQAILALLKAAQPLPKTDADVPEWLDRIGIKPPAAPIVATILQRLIPDVVPPPALQLDSPVALPTMATVQADLAPIVAGLADVDLETLDVEASRVEICSQLEAQAVPVWLIPIVIEAAKFILEWLKNRRSA